MDQPGESMETQHLKDFNILLMINEIFGITLIILMAIWTRQYQNGFSWTSNPKLEFNWHPLLMTIGFVFLYANAMLIYRMQRNVRKRRLKLVHGGMMLFILVFIVTALIAVFDSHNLQNIPNMYTLHSWVGLTTVILFCCQWVAGCILFLYPGLHVTLRTSYLPIHVYFGSAGFIGAIGSCLLGLNEKAIWTLREKYQQFTAEAILINLMGLLIVLFGGLSLYLLSQQQYKRIARPEDEVLLTGREN